MSQQNVEIVRAALDAYNRGDLESSLKDISPGFELDLSRAAGPSIAFTARDQILSFRAEFSEAWESVRIEPHEFIEAGEDVVVPWTMHLTGRDGIEVQARRPGPGRFATVLSNASACIRSGKRLSKPWGCRSSARGSRPARQQDRGTAGSPKGRPQLTTNLRRAQRTAVDLAVDRLPGHVRQLSDLCRGEHGARVLWSRRP